MRQIYLFFATILLFTGFMNAASAAENPRTGDKPKVLVAYFSCSGTTEALAKRVADVLRADLYRIQPQQPYSNADLNYRDTSSRSSVEMNDPAARPTIAGNVADMAQYEIVFLGYPIWWGQAPRIMVTFLESHDFSGKTIVPFCTSGGSGFGSSDRDLHALTDSATWIAGARLNSGASRDDVTTWINGLGLAVIDE